MEPNKVDSVAAAAAVSFTEDQVQAMIQRAVASALRQVAPIGGASAVSGMQKVRVKHEVNPQRVVDGQLEAHGEPTDRVGTVQKVLRRVLHKGLEDDLLAVAFVHPDDGRVVIEEHVASALQAA